MKSIRLVPPRRTIHVATPLEVLAEMAIGCAFVLLPWLGAVAIHWFVSHQLFQ